MPLLRTGAVAFGVVAAAGTIAIAAAFALDPNASPGRWVEGANELVFALVGLGFALRGRQEARPIAGGALGLLGLSVGSSKLPVLLHGVVLSVLPAAATRLAVVVTISAGAAASVVGLVVFFALLDGTDSPSGGGEMLVVGGARPAAAPLPADRGERTHEQAAGDGHSRPDP
jgi:hypothetical protein